MYVSKCVSMYVCASVSECACACVCINVFSSVCIACVYVSVLGISQVPSQTFLELF